MNCARGNLKTEGGNPKTENRKPKEIRKPKAERTLCREMSCEDFDVWRWGDEVGTELMALGEGAADYARGNPKFEGRNPKADKEGAITETMSAAIHWGALGRAPMSTHGVWR